MAPDFRVQVPGFGDRVLSFGFQVSNLGHITGTWFSGTAFRVWRVRLGVSGFRVSSGSIGCHLDPGFQLRVPGLEFWGFRERVLGFSGKEWYPP